MAQTVRNIDRLSEAMKTLDEFAQFEKREIKDLLVNQYDNLRKTLVEIEPEIRDTIRHTSERISRFAETAEEKARMKAKEMVKNVDQKAHESPWIFMGLSAALAGVLGFYIARRYTPEK